ncbi:MAG TPA: polymer-forming cytoskeletal protein [Polyangiaceae bacterium]|nr:polymer-forming cytoskeletal protein [Polyangiaceae bacterium]
MARQTTEVSVLGSDTRVTGRVSGEGSLRIEGALRGDLQVSGDAAISETGTVEGNVQADSVDVAGSLTGDVSTRGAIAIRNGAVIRGELKASEVSIEPGARVSVRLDTELELDLSQPKRR